MMFETPCIETILYPEFSQSNRPANISDQTINAGNHQLLLISSPAYYTLLKTTENYTLQIQPKNQVCLSHPRVSTRPWVPMSHVPESPVPEFLCPTSWVPHPQVPVPESQSPRPHPTFTHSQNDIRNYGIYGMKSYHKQLTFWAENPSISWSSLVVHGFSWLVLSLFT